MCDHLGGYSVRNIKGQWYWTCIECGARSRSFAFQMDACIDFTRNHNKTTC